MSAAGGYGTGGRIPVRPEHGSRPLTEDDIRRIIRDELERGGVS
jgi:hypothetical protein